MTVADDIKGLKSSRSTEDPDEKPEPAEAVPANKQAHIVGPESEVRGGPEAPAD